MHPFDVLLAVVTAGANLLLFDSATICSPVEEVIVDLDIVLMVVVLSEHTIALVLWLVWLHVMVFKSHWLIVALVPMVWGEAGDSMAAIALCVGGPLAHFLSLNRACRGVRLAFNKLKWGH